MGFLTEKNSIYLTILCLLGITAPFWHVIYGIRDTEGMFGYRFMSSFLNSLGTRICILSSGLLLYFFSFQISNEYKKVARLISFITIYVGCYFLILIFLPKKTLLNAFGVKDFHQSFYYVSMFLISILSVVVFTKFQKIFLLSEERLKSIIRKLFNYILVEVRKGDMIKENELKRYNKRSAELVKNVLDNE